jgi:DNA-binding transcriptional ArsR family regulator
MALAKIGRVGLDRHLRQQPSAWIERCRDPYIVRVVVNDTFIALAHPVRRRIVERLTRGSATVGVATRDFGLSKPAISRHLKVLENAGLLRRTVKGRTHQLDLNMATLDGPYEWLTRQRDVWQRMFDAVEDQLEQTKAGG